MVVYGHGFWEVSALPLGGVRTTRAKRACGGHESAPAWVMFYGVGGVIRALGVPGAACLVRFFVQRLSDRMEITDPFALLGWWGVAWRTGGGPALRALRSLQLSRAVCCEFS